MEGKILLEVAFIKDNNIYNKNLKIYKKTYLLYQINSKIIIL